MSRYGIDYYGLALYGPDTYVDFSSGLSATPYSYSSIFLKWDSPSGNWSRIRLVRNPYGFPVTPFDGVTLMTKAFGDDPTEYLDESDLAEAAYYYYSLFVYDINQYVWVKTGEAHAVSVKRYGNQDKLWDYLPDVYKLSTITSYSVTSENRQLRGFLDIFGFWFDHANTVIELLVNRYDVTKVNSTLIPLMLKQFGITYESEIGAQQARVLLRDAVQLQKEKGSLQGLKEYVKSFSGYSLASPVTGASLPAVEGVVIGHNMMLSYDDSSFEDSIGNWEPTTATRAVKLSELSISGVSISSNVATITVGSHSYIAGNKITVSDCLPLFNTTTPVTITSVTATTISFNLTSADISQRTASGTVSPYPLPWSEPTAPVNFPNKSAGLLSISKQTSGSGAVSASCGKTSPIDKGIPVKSGSQYTFSYYAASGSATRDFTAAITWYDRFGTELSTITGSATTSSVGALAVRPYVVATAPANSAYAIPTITVASVSGSNAEIHYVDACQFELGAAATEFDESRNIHITLKANRINEIKNPQFEAPYSHWSFTGATPVAVPLIAEPGSDIFTVVSSELNSNYATLTFSAYHHLEVGEQISVIGVGTPYDGTFTITGKTTKTVTYALTNANIPTATASGQVFHASNVVELTSTSTAIKVATTSGLPNFMPIYYPGSSYTLSVFFKSDDAGVHGTASINWYDLSGTLISTSLGSVTSTTSDWNRMYVTGTAPSNAAYSSVEFNITTSTIGDSVYIHQALFERGSFVLDYFDGDAEGENVSLEDVFWEGGVPNSGRSHFYKNRVATVYRLKATLPDYLTLGSTFALYLAQPAT